MPQFYVPANGNAAQIAHGLMPHTAPNVLQPHFEREKEAKAYLTQPFRTPYYGDPQCQSTPKEPLTFGPKQTVLAWPAVTFVYRVEVEDQEKLHHMQLCKKTHAGIGVSQNTTLDPSSVLSVTAAFSKDPLHKEWDAPAVEPRLGEQINLQHVTDQLLQRGADLQRLYHILERSGPREREELDLDNPEHADIIHKLCVYNKEEKLRGSLEERAMQTVLRQLGENIGVRTAIELSKSQIEAEFNARLEAQPPETPPAERVAVAMEGTLQKFSAQVPTRDAETFTQVAAQVRGTINNLAEEIKSERISEFELSSLPDELRPAWMKVPEDDKEKFIETFRRHRQERAELDAAADKAAFVATTAAMSRAAEQIGDMTKVEAYEDISDMLDDIERGDEEPAPAK